MTDQKDAEGRAPLPPSGLLDWDSYDRGYREGLRAARKSLCLVAECGDNVVTKATRTRGRVISVQLEASYVVMTYNGFVIRYLAGEFDVVGSEEEAKRLAGDEDDE